ncbi:MAG: arylsulfatase A-like enzyme [Verrucomicrobiales bacterium]|jgi:arylsulfatase A-like enzyme
MKFLTAIFAFTLASAAAGADAKTNFVFFLVDDLGFMDVGFNNPDTFYETPNCDRLAREGMILSDAYAACQVCSPTRSSIMCGKYPARTDATNFFSGKRGGRFQSAEMVDRMALEEVTIAEALKEGGYTTCFAGKWHLGPEGFWPTDQGFDYNFGGGSNGLPRSYFEPYKNVENLSPRKEGDYLTKRLADESCGFLEAAEDQPFLLYLAFYNVHTPLQAPKNLVEKYKVKAEKLGLTDEAGRFDSKRERQVWPDTKQPRKVRIRQDHAVYAAMMESMDNAVGQVAAKLDELGLSDDTAIFFMSDNGGLSTSEGLPTSNLPLRGGKGWMYEGGVREPVFVKWPGVTKPGSSCSHPVISTDFFPTILEMAGLPAKPEQHVDGVSFAALLRDPEAKLDRDAIFWHYPHYANQGGIPASAVRMGDLKLIQDLETGDDELYDLSADLAEQKNVAAQHPEKVEAMRKRLRDWRTEVDAKMLRPNPKTGEAPPEL